ncbi:helix-turn-helix transcriptional regulator [Puerhibacterium puerhi]|uniref:helix-turn-helix transcriptional regulator n=1 Tax=Puerhibacterium puerhi TaxID=2692623 RepID=UPI001357D468|nr:LuxR C-terminal-related transcriptional regulator [Puerhibacterium puerhi]
MLPRALVRRPRLEASLDTAVERRLTLVSAGPGWGKTTTVAAWARTRAGRVAWVTLEPYDDTPTTLWADVLAAVRGTGVAPPGHPLDAVQIPARFTSDLLRRLLFAVDMLPAPVVLVLDDFHHVADPEVLESIDDLLRYPLPLHLVVLTRLDPMLSLQRLRGRGEVVELGAGDLAFDESDVASLGALEGRRLAPAQVDRLLADTGGWPVGVRLRVEAPTGPAGRARAERSAAEFLLTEVLDRLDRAQRQFLLRTSVAADVCAELAAVLDPGAPAARLLLELAASNGFVTALDAQGTWYRYHPLLREMLRHELQLEDPGHLQEAHRAAARWFARHGEPLRALEHAVDSGDWSLVGDVVVDAAAAHLVGPRRPALAAALARVPFATLDPDPSLHLCAAVLALATDRFDAAEQHIARGRALLAADAEGAETPAAVLLEVLDAAAARVRGDVRRLAAAGAAAVAAADRAPFPFLALETYRSLGREDERAGLAWCGVDPPAPLPGDVRALSAADPTYGGEVDPQGPADVADGDLRAARELVGLGARSAAALQAVASGRPSQGERLARAVLEEASARGWAAHVQTRGAHAALGWAELLRADDAAAAGRLVHALTVRSGGCEPASEAAVHLLQALLAASHGHSQGARRSLAECDRVLGAVALPPLLADLRARVETELAVLDSGGPRDVAAADGTRCSPQVADVSRARVLLATGRAGAAARSVAGVPGGREGELDALTRVEALLVEASALGRAGTRRADRAVERALDTAEPEELALPFLTVATADLRPVVAGAVAHRPGPLARTLRERLPVAVDRPGPDSLVEPLTERELAILAVLPTMESNVEIAEDFVVSVNTVKAHLKALYRKLGVASRRDAVRRGRELGLIR